MWPRHRESQAKNESGVEATDNVALEIANEIVKLEPVVVNYVDEFEHDTVELGGVGSLEVRRRGLAFWPLRLLIRRLVAGVLWWVGLCTVCGRHGRVRRRGRSGRGRRRTRGGHIAVVDHVGLGLDGALGEDLASEARRARRRRRGWR